MASIQFMIELSVFGAVLWVMSFYLSMSATLSCPAHSGALVRHPGE
ncbi:hypothetical protein [Thiocystis violacea]|nr:hypothetical protein [Thiocystis violacea]